tara:strand:- start:6852 stop:7226 length:375 start_codon:yes stop_codon:yes gene_type:complete
MFLQKILLPDKSNFIIKLYHKSNKIMIPFLVPSILLNENNDLKKYFDFFNINNLGFHSFVSFSTIVTDYHKKLPFINEKILRLANLKIHGFLVLFFSYNLYNKYYNALDYNYNYLKRRETIPYL